MPPVPGILCLLTLMFAPEVELRVNEYRTNYTGCLSGLGCNGEKAIYKDHDLEVPFQVNLDNDDLNVINEIRSSLNQLIRSEKTAKPLNREDIQEKMRTDIRR